MAGRITKWKIILGVVGLLFLVAAWQYIGYLFKYAYSRGTRTGIVRKLSVKGPPYCKYLEGELALQGNFGSTTDVFKFSADNHDDNNAIVKQLHDAEKNGTRVTLDYRQDRAIWWRCNPSEYFIVGLEK